MTYTIAISQKKGWKETSVAPETTFRKRDRHPVSMAKERICGEISPTAPSSKRKGRGAPDRLALHGTRAKKKTYGKRSVGKGDRGSCPRPGPLERKNCVWFSPLLPPFLLCFGERKSQTRGRRAVHSKRRRPVVAPPCKIQGGKMKTLARDDVISSPSLMGKVRKGRRQRCFSGYPAKIRKKSRHPRAQKGKKRAKGGRSSQRVSSMSRDSSWQRRRMFEKSTRRPSRSTVSRLEKRKSGCFTEKLKLEKVSSSASDGKIIEGKKKNRRKNDSSCRIGEKARQAPR